MSVLEFKFCSILLSRLFTTSRTEFCFMGTEFAPWEIAAFSALTLFFTLLDSTSTMFKSALFCSFTHGLRAGCLWSRKWLRHSIIVFREIFWTDTEGTGEGGGTFGWGGGDLFLSLLVMITANSKTRKKRSLHHFQRLFFSIAHSDLSQKQEQS